MKKSAAYVAPSCGPESAEPLRGVPATSLMHSKCSVTGLVGVLSAGRPDFVWLSSSPAPIRPAWWYWRLPACLTLVVTVRGPPGGARRTIFLALLSPP